MYALALRLQEKLQHRGPALELIVYSNMLNLPRRPLPVSDRVYAFFCSYLRHFRHRVYDPGGPDEIATGVCYPEPDRINPVDEREYGRIFESWLPVWREAGTVPALFEYTGHFIDETERTDHQRYLRIAPAQFREDEARWYAARGLRLAILCGGAWNWPDAFPGLAWAQSLWGNERMSAFRERYYTALAGSHGTQLADAVDGVSAALKHEDGVPEQALRDLDDVLQALPETPQVNRYRDWTEFIRRGRTARALFLQGNMTQTAAAEEQVRAFVHQHQHRIPVAHMLLKDSEVFEQRARERLAGRKAEEYRL